DTDSLTDSEIEFESDSEFDVDSELDSDSEFEIDSELDVDSELEVDSDSDNECEFEFDSDSDSDVSIVYQWVVALKVAVLKPLPRTIVVPFELRAGIVGLYSGCADFKID
ncbi:hypothetical protein, partial [Streptococcus suis]|uniref:hypothetical protein n=1 Tax=Streptococcus suis TaxID=1307 RepID=UPI0012901CA3